MRHADMAATLALLYNIRIPKNSIGLPIFFPSNMLKSEEDIDNIKNSIYKTIYNQYSDVISQSKVVC